MRGDMPLVRYSCVAWAVFFYTRVSSAAVAFLAQSPTDQPLRMIMQLMHQSGLSMLYHTVCDRSVSFSTPSNALAEQGFHICGQVFVFPACIRF